MPRFARLTMTLCVTLATLTACAPQKGDKGDKGDRGESGESIIGPVGPRGEPGQNAIIEVIDPCGKQAIHDEVLIRLADGRLLAYFENGNKRYLTILNPNTVYTTTDGTSCTVVIDANGGIH